MPETAAKLRAKNADPRRHLIGQGRVGEVEVKEAGERGQHEIGDEPGQCLRPTISTAPIGARSAHRLNAAGADEVAHVDCATKGMNRKSESWVRRKSSNLRQRRKATRLPTRRSWKTKGMVEEKRGPSCQ